MADYRVTFDRIGRDRDVGTITFEDVENREQLENRLLKLARAKLMSQDIAVWIYADRGHFSAGFRNAGNFTVEELSDDPLSADRPCDWVMGRGVRCGKPSADVRWGTVVIRWHCPEHVAEAKRLGWQPQTQPKMAVTTVQTSVGATGEGMGG